MTSAPPASVGRPRRSATESLLSIVLVLEALVVFFAMLVAFALDVLPAPIAFGGGAAFILVIIVTGRLVKSAVGRIIGWVVQALLIASGILIPLMFVVGAGFALLYIYCFITGTRLDKRNAEIDRLSATDDPARPSQEES